MITQVLMLVTSIWRIHFRKTIQLPTSVADDIKVQQERTTILLSTMQLRINIATKTYCAGERRRTEGQTHQSVHPVGVIESRNKDSFKS